MSPATQAMHTARTMSQYPISIGASEGRVDTGGRG